MAPAVVQQIASRLQRMSQGSDHHHHSSTSSNQNCPPDVSGPSPENSLDSQSKSRSSSLHSDTSVSKAHRHSHSLHFHHRNEPLDDIRKKRFGRAAKALCKADFELVKTLGTGTFARVWLVKSAHPVRRSTFNTSQDLASVASAPADIWALKILRKVDVIRLKQVEHVRNERNVLATVAGHPFIINLISSFQDTECLYMLLDYCPGGEVFSYLRRARRFNEATSQFYAAEIVLVLEFLHNEHGVAYRDLKPENILIDAEGHLKLVDFGFAKKIDNRETYTLCGTPEYLAPEVIRNTGHGLAVDWWALGILIYEFLVGQPPFWDQNPMKIYEQIVEGKLRYPSAMSPDARDIIGGLCNIDVTKRLGNMKSGALAIKQHPWFRSIDWTALQQRKEQGPIVPHLKSADDTRNFDEYDAEPLHRDHYTKELKEKYDQSFADF